MIILKDKDSEDNQRRSKKFREKINKKHKI